ncbi:T9SS type A sorting domain-containing protein [Lewinella cohaerens]|uniref:T9SS type A sorting domain-containing protein n=1 Tax=Lewinella cohaerens TaxID=70995 RepID=UPI00036F1694|nr:T9SS type A sorting domain-containing protein [Lewinella cohaerens]
MRTLKFFFSVLFLFLGIYSPIIAQDYIMDGSPITDCSGVFFDPGGDDDYEANTTLSTLICSDGTGSTHSLLQFSSIQVLPGDTLRFYDGNDASAPLLTPPVSIHSGIPFSVQATAANLTGCLYVEFSSDDEGESDGWEATIACLSSCQPIIADIASMPPAIPNTPFIDICPGDTVRFDAQAIFPQNGLVYPQDLTTSTINWQFGDGTFNNSSQVEKVFTEPGFYLVQLNITDEMGCPTVNIPFRFVRVSPGISLAASELLQDTYCWGDTILLYTLLDSLNNIPGFTLLPSTLVTYSAGALGDTLLLPDGSGGQYESAITFNQFPAGATVGDENPLDSLWMDLEHSYSGDLDIELVCPNGNSIYLLDYPSGIGSTNFGEPFANNPVDGVSSDITFGIPYRYTFVPESTNGTLIEFDVNAPTYSYTTVPSDVDGNIYTYTDTYFPAGSYEPEDSFNDLQGCPLNGEWKIRVTDNLGLDNGVIFSWGINVEGEIEANGEEIVSAATWYWENSDDILFQNLDSIIILPLGIGLTTLQFTIEDNLGCLTDTTITLEILPSDDPNCMVNDAEYLLENDAWAIYPNPFNDNFTVKINDSPARYQLEVYNALGQKTISKNFANEENISTENWSAGIYFLRIKDQEGHVLVVDQLVKVR